MHLDNSLWSCFLAVHPPYYRREFSDPIALIKALTLAEPPQSGLSCLPSLSSWHSSPYLFHFWSFQIFFSSSKVPCSPTFWAFILPFLFFYLEHSFYSLPIWRIPAPFLDLKFRPLPVGCFPECPKSGKGTSPMTSAPLSHQSKSPPVS